jgi:hypothetical protein
MNNQQTEQPLYVDECPWHGRVMRHRDYADECGVCLYERREQEKRRDKRDQQDRHYEQLRERFVEQLPDLKELIEYGYGPRCKGFDINCGKCQMYMAYDILEMELSDD